MNLDDFKFTTRIRKINLWLQIVLGMTLFFSLNYIAAKHYMRWDVSESNKNSISPESSAYIKNLKTPIDIYVVVSTQNTANENSETVKELRAFLSRYEYESKSPNKIRVHFVNSILENRKSEDLAKRFGSAIENSVVVASKERFKIIPISEFYSQGAAGDGEPAHRKFSGEALTTSAILNVSEKKQPKIYFTRGHGELDLKSANSVSGLSEFASALESRNYKLEVLNYNQTKSFPKDADMIIAAAPAVPFSAVEVEHLRRYLMKEHGRVVVFLRMGDACGLGDLFYEWGIMSDNMQVLDSGGDYESAEGDLIARTFPEKSHPIVKYLLAADMPVQFGSVRPVRRDLGAPADGSLEISPLILSSGSSWAEKSYMRGGAQKYDEAADLPGPLPLAIIVNRTGGTSHGLKIPGGKLAVFGDENFIANKWFHRLGNSVLAINTVNWMFEDGKMLNIPPRKMKMFSMTVSNNELLGLGLRLLILPTSILLLGLVVSFVRRN